MKITLEMHGDKWIYESEYDGIDGGTLLNDFQRMMVGAGYPPSVIDCDDGRYEYVGKDEVVVKRTDKEEK